MQPIKEEKGSLKEDLKDLGRNKPWWVLLCVGIAALVFNSPHDGSAVFCFKYYVDSSGTFSFPPMNSAITLITIYLALGQAANILGIMFAPSLTKRIGKEKTYFMAMVGATILSVLSYSFPKDSIQGILCLQVLISIRAGIISPLLWSMHADISDYSEWKTGGRATGLIFPSPSMSQKFGWAIGGVLIGWLLTYFGFKANAIQSDFARTGTYMMMSIFPVVATMPSAFFILRYPLGEKRLYEILTELEERRKK